MSLRDKMASFSPEGDGSAIENVPYRAQHPVDMRKSASGRRSADRGGVIYILTNPSFPDYIKIGFATDMQQRLHQLNRSECIPFAFQVYAIYEVDHALVDLDLHNLIDRLNPNLRAIEDFNGKRRVREFYAMSPEDAYSLLENIAKIHGRTNKLRRIANMTNTWQMSDGDVVPGVSTTRGSASSGRAQKHEKQGKVSQTGRAKAFSFSMVGIPVGAAVEFCCEGDEHSGLICRVVDDKHVWHDNQTWSLSSLAKMLIGAPTAVQGPAYFKYNGEWLNDMRKRLGV